MGATITTMNNKIIEGRIKKLYRNFFKELDINPNSGVLKHNKKRKFATYPYIGSKYAHDKILFIGLDIGRDEMWGIKGFEKRREDIEQSEWPDEHSQKISMNPHIAGLYISTIYLLKRRSLTRIRNEKSYIASVRKFKEKCDDNLLPRVALTNLHKFVTVGRNKRAGGKDRRFESEEHEKQLLFDEIKIFAPKIIIFQTKHRRYAKLIKALKKLNKRIQICMAPHPACRGYNTPKTYINEWEVV